MSAQYNGEESTAQLPRVNIEYCTGCRWLLRSAWLAQELLTTFEADLDSVTLTPSRARPGGVFDITVDGEVIWSRKSEGRFPEAKEVKQRIRDIIAPQRDLGHSDVKVVDAEFEVDEKE
eukprot:CAMPEP_0196736554 /NCGR_PEP_ID=MMETSP1091-20130531/14576_1 /TAXON_ID=302021 /ORGANISM="Rhodomonas sp., Strain CCMP768" /LENGTH=118 /DNA_ID=CAMNT_0042080303 /DNA_START=80 /DNA_END=436 /DNA_ORIENTATION=-